MFAIIAAGDPGAPLVAVAETGVDPPDPWLIPAATWNSDASFPPAAVGPAPWLSDLAV